MDATTAAIWSAIAASFSAASSTLAMGIQRRNLHASLRPELVALGWERRSVRRGNQETDVLSIPKLKNVGRGVSTHGLAILSGQTMRGSIPTALMAGPKPIPVLATGEECSLDLEINLLWNNVKERRGVGKFLQLNLVVMAWDVLDQRYAATYRLTVFPMPAPFISEPLAPGVFGIRVVKSRSTWFLKAQRKLGSLPGFGRLSKIDP